MDQSTEALALEEALSTYLETVPDAELFLFLSFMLLILSIKGFALWTAAQNNNKGWFVALLFLNTLGILEILYLLVFSKRKSDELGGE
jgi:methionyl-tRNA synthetase